MQCSESECAQPRSNDSAYCDAHTSIRWALYQTNSKHGGYDKTWQRKRARFLYLNPWCVRCRAVATHADHHPLDRRTMWSRGYKDMDEPNRLRALCQRCHNKHTAKEQGTFSAKRKTQSAAGREFAKWQRIRGTDAHGNTR